MTNHLLAAIEAHEIQTLRAAVQRWAERAASGEAGAAERLARWQTVLAYAEGRGR